MKHLLSLILLAALVGCASPGGYDPYEAHHDPYYGSRGKNPRDYGYEKGPAYPPGTKTVQAATGAGAVVGLATGLLIAADPTGGVVGTLVGAGLGALTGELANRASDDTTAHQIAYRRDENPDVAVNPHNGTDVLVTGIPDGTLMRDERGRYFQVATRPVERLIADSNHPEERK